MPMRKTSDEVISDRANLWIIDEKMAFHHYLASDKLIKSMPITQSDSDKKPDIFALNLLENPILVSESSHFPLAAITIIEIKKPMRDDMAAGEDKNPLEQVLGYLERIRNGGVLTKEKRPIPKSEEIPGFCYVICDLTESMVRCCTTMFDLTRTGVSGILKYSKNGH